MPNDTVKSVIYLHPETLAKALENARRRNKPIGEYLADLMRTVIRSDYKADKDRKP